MSSFVKQDNIIVLQISMALQPFPFLHLCVSIKKKGLVFVKKWTASLMAAVLLFVAGCGQNIEPSVSVEEPDEWGITLSAEDVTPTGMTLVCTQSGGKPLTDLTTGRMFRLERLKKGEWKLLPALMDRVAWNMDALGVQYEGSVEWEIGWEKLYGTLPPGTYRVVKQISGYRSMGAFTTKTYYAEFIIEK